MSLIGLDLNSSRARAVAGPRHHALAQLCLDGDQVELPLALSLEGRQVQVGRPGLSLSRRRPHLACLDFLSQVGSGREWSANGHRLDADRALALVFAALAGKLARTSGVVLSLPGYLSDDQLVEARCLASAAKLQVIGTLPAPLAAVLAAYGDEAGWPDPESALLVVDADGHALTWSVLQRDDNELRLRQVQPSTQLGRGLWLRKLMDGVAHRCIRHSRRDPRESAETDQMVYEQLARLLDGPAQAQVRLRVQGPGWYHDMVLPGEDLVAFVAPLLRQALVEMDAALSALANLGRPAGAVLTAQAAGLPGLVSAVRARMRAIVPAAPAAVDDDADLGDLLVSPPGAPDGLVHVLPPDALARSAHALAVRIHRGDVPPSHLDGIALPAATRPRADTGPARLSFRGQDHLLSGSPFVLGRDPTCNLVFESELYPHVSGRHCEVVFDRRAYTVRDHSRHGTFVNDRPISQQALHSGDWIRLGPQGPLLRFLGEPAGELTPGHAGAPR
jgi:hypothetical protein